MPAGCVSQHCWSFFTGLHGLQVLHPSGICAPWRFSNVLTLAFIACYFISHAGCCAVSPFSPLLHSMHLSLWHTLSLHAMNASSSTLEKRQGACIPEGWSICSPRRPVKKDRQCWDTQPAGIKLHRTSKWISLVSSEMIQCCGRSLKQLT